MSNEKGLRIEKGIVIKYSGKEEEVKLPSDVIRIAPYAFYGCKTLKRIITPPKLASIGKGAFYGCDNLEEATIPGRLYRRVRGGKAFDKSANIYFRFYASPDKEFDDEDYSDKFESEADYLSSGEDDSAHAYDNLKGNGGGEVVNLIEEIIDPPAPEPYVPIEDDPETLQEKMQAIVPEEPKKAPLSEERKSELTNIDDYIIEGDVVIKYIGTKKQTVVPEFITKIGDNAFANGDVENVILPAGLKIIEKTAFGWCEKLKEITFPDGLEIIDDFAFADCSSLTKIILPESVQFIGASAFHACSSVKILQLPSCIKQISRRAFDFCVSLEKLYLPDSVEKLHEGAFAHCESLTTVRLPEGISEIGSWAFAECFELREINFPEGLTEIGEVAFMNCKTLVAFDLPLTLKQIGRQAFVGCEELRLVKVPKNLEKEIKPKKVFHRLRNISITYFS